MKILILFLCMVVVVLTVIPCCAVEHSEFYTHQNLEKEKGHSCSEQDDDCCKDCSPFYVCGTCTGFTPVQVQTLTFTVLQKPFKHNTIYISPELPLIAIVIWQPPKLS